MDWRQRSAILLGEAGLARLAGARVCVAGMGAVGSYAAEALARGGIGALRLVDFDIIRATNINRQLHARHSTLGRLKVEAAAERLADINPALALEPLARFIHEETLDEILAPRPGLVIDCIDSLNPKVALLAGCRERGITVLSAMGAANRTDPAQVRAGDISATSGCPLARFVRKRLRRRGINEGVWCVYSAEPPAAPPRPPAPEDGRAAPERALRAAEQPEYERGRERGVIGSLPTLPGIFGLWLANEALVRMSHGQ